MNETLKISDHRFPRLSLFFATIFFLSILICVNSEVLGETHTGILKDPFILAALLSGTVSLILWLALKFFKRNWTFERPLRIGLSSAFQSAPHYLVLPDACTLFRRGRRLFFVTADQLADNPGPASGNQAGNNVGVKPSGRAKAEPAPVVTLTFTTQRVAILTENRLLEFLDPERSRPIEAGAPLIRQMRFAPVTFALIALNILLSVFAWTRGDTFVMSGALSRTAVAHGEYYRLVSNTFLHYNGIHLIMNMLALWSLGVQVERIVGHLQMLLIYAVSGIAGGFWALQFIGSISLLGASGAVFGLFGAVAYFIFLGRDLLPASVYLPTRRQLTTDLMINAGLSLLPFVSFSAHFGGFVSGFIVSGVLFRIFR